MKRSLIIPAFLLFLSFPAFAQVKVGVKAGGNYSTISFDAPSRFRDPEFKAGFHAGAFMVIPTGENFYIRQELLYNVKGLKYTEWNRQEKVHLKYLTYALLLGIKLNPKIHFLLGPEVGYLLDVGPKDSRISINPLPTIDNYRRFDAGITGGIAFQVLDRLSLEGRYTHGLAPVADSRTFYFYRQPEGNNRAFQVSLSYTFGTKSDLNKPL